jgi:clan AA aspartic protease
MGKELNMPFMSSLLPSPQRKSRKLMGLTHLTVRIANPTDSKRHKDIEFLVDSGAIYSVVPKEILKELGISPHSRRSFVLANGEKLERQLGTADVIYKKRRGAATVIFGEKGDFALLGVTALESLGLILDPIRRKLKSIALTV